VLLVKPIPPLRILARLGTVRGGARAQQSIGRRYSDPGRATLLTTLE
jgi:hypothetical protein